MSLILPILLSDLARLGTSNPTNTYLFRSALSRLSFRSSSLHPGLTPLPLVAPSHLLHSSQLGNTPEPVTCFVSLACELSHPPLRRLFLRSVSRLDLSLVALPLSPDLFSSNKLACPDLEIYPFTSRHTPHPFKHLNTTPLPSTLNYHIHHW